MRFCTQAHPKPLGWLTPWPRAVGTTEVPQQQPGRRWACLHREVRVPVDVPRFGGRWLEITPMANGTNSERILGEYLVLQYLGADSFQGRQAPTCKVFLHSQTIVIFRACRDPVFKKTIFKSETKASNFLSKHYDPGSTMVVTPAAVTGDRSRVNNKRTCDKGFIHFKLSKCPNPQD